MSIEVAGSAIGRKAGWLGPNLRGCKSDKGYQLRLIAWPQTAVKPFVPSGRPKERSCVLASRSGTLAAAIATARLPKVSTTVWRFRPAGAWRLCQTPPSNEPSLQSQHFRLSTMGCEGLRSLTLCCLVSAHSLYWVSFLSLYRLFLQPRKAALGKNWQYSSSKSHILGSA